MATRPQDVGTPGVIETARLRLEPWNDAHFERFARFMRDPAVIRYIRAEPLDRASAIEQHEHSLAEWELYGFGKRAIIEAGTSRWLGFVELSLVGPGKGSRDDDVEIGYFVRPDRWRQGIATEAAIATRDEAFGRCRPRRADRPLPGRERRLGARARQGRLQAASPLRARRRHHRRDPSPPARPLDATARAPVEPRARERAPPPERSTVRRGSSVAVVDRVDDERVALRRRPARRPAATAQPEARARARARVGDPDRGSPLDGGGHPPGRRRPAAADLHLRRLTTRRRR